MYIASCVRCHISLLASVSMASAWLLLTLAALLLSPKPTEAQNIGVCLGRNGDNLPAAQDVVKLYESNGIYKMRVYSPDQDILQAVQGSGIALILGVPNQDIKSLGSNSSAAAQWVHTNVVPFASNVLYIAVGNVVMPGDSNAQFLLPAMQNVQKALVTAGLAAQIKVSTAVKSSLLSNTFPPSNSDFGSKSNSAYFTPIVKFLKSNGSPLLANIYPYFSLVDNRGSISLQYALFTSSGTVVTDSGNDLQYQNLFDALVDSFYAALEKAGGGGVGIVVSETGWPSQGTDVATPANAATYYRKLIGHVARGTPKKQGQPLETYLFAMFDEDEKQGDEVERHFGLFTPDQQNKYAITYPGAVPILLGSLCYD